MLDISAIIITKNEEKNIVDCIDTLKWCRQILVIDDFSEDRTAEIAKINGAQVYEHQLNQDFSNQRNFALSKSETGWVMFIDADERVSEELRKEIEKELVSSEDIKGYTLSRKDILWGTTLNHGETGHSRFLRLAKKDAGEWQGKVHEVWRINGKTKALTNSLIHYPHQDISMILSEINFYTDLRAKELSDNGLKATWREIIFYPIAKFIVNFKLKLGFLDGVPGLLIAIFMSFHSFLVRAKLWELNQKKLS